MKKYYVYTFAPHPSIVQHARDVHPVHGAHGSRARVQHAYSIVCFIAPAPLGTHHHRMRPWPVCIHIYGAHVHTHTLLVVKTT